MSVHPSLKSGKNAQGALRNVMKRHERVRHLIESGSWEEGRSMFGLPKIKQTKIKSRKSGGGKDKEDTEKAGKESETKAAGAGAKSKS